MDLRPAEIAMRQFSRALFGADPEEVKGFLAEAAATLERVNTELTRVRLERTELQTELQNSKKKAEAEVEELRRQLVAAQEKIAAHQKQESQMAQALMNAQRVTDDLIQSSKARADRIVAEAKAASQVTMEAARKEAADGKADALASAEATRKEAVELKAAAQAAVEAARREAAELLRATQAQAQEAVRAADRAAEARMAQIQRESERLAEQARKEVSELQQTAVQQVERFVVNMKAFLSNWEGLSRNLEVLARSHAGALEAIAQTRAEVESGVLPVLRDLLRGLSAKGGTPLREAVAAAAPPDLSPFAPPAPPPAPIKPAAATPPSAPFKPGPAPSSTPAPTKPAAAPPSAPTPSRPATAKPGPMPPPSPAPSQPAQPVRPSPAPDAERVPVGAAQGQAEIVVSPVNSYLQASRLVTAVSRIKGVKTARLRAYSKGMITIDVMTEEGTLAGISDDLRTGFPVDVVESTDTRLVLTLANGRVPAPSQVKESSN